MAPVEPCMVVALARVVDGVADAADDIVVAECVGLDRDCIAVCF